MLALCLVFLAIDSYESFSWELNALSDLGIILGKTMYFFNFGLIIGGILCLFFSSGLYLLFENKKLGRISSFFFILACFFLIAIGLFPENFKPIHYIVSIGFFLFLPISLFLFFSSFYLYGKFSFAIFTILIAVIVAMPWGIYFSSDFFTGVAIPEIISGLVASIWIIILGLKMIFDPIKIAR